MPGEQDRNARRPEEVALLHRLSRLRPHVTYANVAATLALALALGVGGAYAAPMILSGDIAKNAVRTQHIKNGHVRTPDIKKGAVTRDKLKNPKQYAQVRQYSLGEYDFAPLGYLYATLPGPIGGTWTVEVQRPAGNVYPLPGSGVNGQTDYRVYWYESGDNVELIIQISDGPGEGYSDVRVVHALPTERARVSIEARGTAPRPER